MLEGKALMVLGAGVALLGTLVGSSSLAGPTRSEVLLAFGAILALTLCRRPRKP
jgi:hypothetical protein